MKFTIKDRDLMLTEASHEEMKTLEFFLIRKADNYRFNPLYKKGHWDGNISFFKSKRYIRSGLWKELLILAKDNNYSFEIENFEQLIEKKITENDFRLWIINKFPTDKIREYQVEAAWKIIKGKACIAELATSAGKSFIIFMIYAFLFDNKIEDKFIMIVPTVQLVLQATSDFEEYLTWLKEPLSVKLRFQGIASGMKINPSANVVIGTYQSLVKKKKEFFDPFGIVACDECHMAKALSIQLILEKCKAQRRFGVTGTIPKVESISRLNIMSNLGPCVYELKAKELIDNNFITDVTIHCIRLNYKDDVFKEALYEVSKTQDGKFMLEKERAIVIDSTKRLNFISNLTNKIQKNVLILFNRIEYGNKLYDTLKANLPNREIYYVDGSINKDIREEVRADMENGTGKILIASYGTFSTGVNIRNIHYIVFTESYKSDVIVRQSIGRGLRKHKDKDILTLIDIVDDFTIKKESKYRNRLVQHFYERLKIYKEQKFTYKISFINL